eukprot:Platyproteum_vivax@DN6752_c0_g1_i1.p1
MMQDGRIAAPGQPGRNSKVIVQTTTWERDSHDLFDYEARHVSKASLDVEESSKIYRSEAEVLKVPENQGVPKNAELLIKVVITKDGKCLIAPPEKTSSTTARKLWLVVKDLKTPFQGHILSEGDTIKLGRFRLRVRQICRADQPAPELRLFDDGELPVVINLRDRNISDHELSTVPCRICLLDGQGEDKDDPLIDPCACNGSIKWVHLNCLKHWIDGRRKTDQQGQSAGSLFFKQLQCELCKHNYPISVITREGRKLTLVSMPKPEGPFIILENTTNVNRGFHILSMAQKKTLKLGRGHECDVRISDVSISRTHATIRYSEGTNINSYNNSFVLEDHESKFGTLICIRKQQSLDYWSGTLSLQVGRTTLKVAYEDIYLAEQSRSDAAAQFGGGETGANGDSNNTPANSHTTNAFPPHPNAGAGGGGGARSHNNLSGTTLGNCRLVPMFPHETTAPPAALLQAYGVSHQPELLYSSDRIYSNSTVGRGWNDHTDPLKVLNEGRSPTNHLTHGTWYYQQAPIPHPPFPTTLNTAGSRSMPTPTGPASSNVYNNLFQR